MECSGPCLGHCYGNKKFIFLGILIGFLLYYLISGYKSVYCDSDLNEL